MNRTYKIFQNRGMLIFLIVFATFIFSSCSLKPNEKIQNEAFQFSAPPKKTFKQMLGDDRKPSKFFAFDHAYSKGEIHKTLRKGSSWHRNISITSTTKEQKNESNSK
jgi:hypothetical protein